ncbi:hypothetical protein [Actinoplanes subtropicus]|uniref:hypothetical protein n=1 Tax=Actinoplanes subtropicus TaxID=543632 RepID=UPI0004C426F4|nr:hypothetical protein [Actinoplanes subtropicus]
MVTARAQLATLGTFVERASEQVGTCPSCGKPITGRDLFAVSRCPSCRAPLTELLAPRTTGPGGLDPREMLLIAGALGALIGLYVSSRK